MSLMGRQEGGKVKFKNIFVLCTGRCGSVTFSKACKHITNYTSGHETRIKKLDDRLDFPSFHIFEHTLKTALAVLS